MKIYTLSDEYIKFLYKKDFRVPDNKDEYRAYIGTVFNLPNGQRYFAPLSSPKPKHKKMKDNLDFIKIDGGKLGVINLNNMIPVPQTECELINFQNQSQQYQRLLINQQVFLQKNESKILGNANRLYSLCKSKNPKKKIVARCCNFPVLEKAAERWSELTVQASQFWAVEPTATGKKINAGFTILSNPENQWFLLKDGLPKNNSDELAIGDKTTIDDVVAQYGSESPKDMITRFDSKQDAIDYWHKHSAEYSAMREHYPELNEYSKKAQDAINELLPAEFKPKTSGSGSSSGRDERGH